MLNWVVPTLSARRCTSGLIPCPAAITVLLLCLQVKEAALGGMLVLCFSIGLATTLVTVGATAAIGARQASNRWPWLGARRAPYLSSVLIIGVGPYGHTRLDRFEQIRLMTKTHPDMVPQLKGLSASLDLIKWLAMLTMIIDHLRLVWSELSTPFIPGWLAFPLFCVAIAAQF